MAPMLPLLLLVVLPSVAMDNPSLLLTTPPYGYAASGIYAADSVGAIHTAKRSADADAY